MANNPSTPQSNQAPAAVPFSRRIFVNDKIKNKSTRKIYIVAHLDYVIDVAELVDDQGRRIPYNFYIIDSDFEIYNPSAFPPSTWQGNGQPVLATRFSAGDIVQSHTTKSQYKIHSIDQVSHCYVINRLPNGPTFYEHISSVERTCDLVLSTAQNPPEPPKAPMSECRIVISSACGKDFYYCREHDDEAPTMSRCHKALK